MTSSSNQVERHLIQQLLESHATHAAHAAHTATHAIDTLVSAQVQRSLKNCWEPQEMGLMCFFATGNFATGNGNWWYFRGKISAVFVHEV